MTEITVWSMIPVFAALTRCVSALSGATDVVTTGTYEAVKEFTRAPDLSGNIRQRVSNI